MDSDTSGEPAATGHGTAAGTLPQQMPDRSAMDAIAKAAINAMNDVFYSEKDGRWQPEDAWWLSGNALQVVLDYMHKTGSKEYMDKALHVISMQRLPLPWWLKGEGEFRADSTEYVAPRKQTQANKDKQTGWWQWRRKEKRKERRKENKGS